MTAFLIGAAELAALAAGTPMIVATPGTEGLAGLPITVLRPVEGVLRQGDSATGPAVPLPQGLRPLALVAPDAAGAAALAAGLPHGVPTLPANGLLPALVARLVAALAEAEAQRGALHRRIAAQPVAAPRRVIDLPPVPNGPVPPARAMQPLGRDAAGISSLALHVATPAKEAASLLRVRLVAGGRILGGWSIAGRDLAAGWLALDLPEPAPAGTGEAHLEIALDAAAGDGVRISSGGPDAGAPLALRVETAEPGHLRAPRHFDWAARDLPALAPGLVLPLPEGAWAAASVQGATAERVAVGNEAPRLLLALPAGAEARLSLPPMPAGLADLALLEAALRLGDRAQVEVALLAAGVEAPDHPRHSGWRRVDAEGGLRVALPLPAAPSGSIALRLAIRNAGPAASLEIGRLALATGAAGVPRRDPAAPAPQPPAAPAAMPPAAPAAMPPAAPAAMPPAAPAAPTATVPAAPTQAAAPAPAPAGTPRVALPAAPVSPPPAPEAKPTPAPEAPRPSAPEAKPTPTPEAPRPATAPIRIATIPPAPAPASPLLAPTAPPLPSGPAPSRVMLPGSAAPATPPPPFGMLVPARGSAFRVAAPQAPLPAAPAPAAPGIAAPVPVAPPVAAPTAAPPSAPLAFAQDTPTATAYRDLKLNQHLVNKEGTYQHLDLAITGLVAPAGLWRQVRTKLFDRRGTVGLEFRSMKGWPQMFDRWPGTQVDNFGPLWRLEHPAPFDALAMLATPHDRALIAAVLEVLPGLATRAAGTAGLTAEQEEAWVGRARKLAAAVTESGWR
ncbi:DUF6212 domain-containing protein [Falsiroseomonas algicola]|uniref:DUF6212 domain-containing protein n=1 Tax=Falsiroseomonas algicola TaxID=2716930 RepID=UPI001A99A252|nr:DUF6212 domain-containing protein [Falsiroseomonas algicola]